MSQERDRNGTARMQSEPKEDVESRGGSPSPGSHRSRSPRSKSRSRSRSRSPRNRRGNDRGGNRRGDRRGGGGRGGGGGYGKSSSGGVDEHKMVYISNIPYDIRWMELKDLVREKAGDVSFVEMIERDGRSKGCAVVEFKSRESAVKCIENMHRMQLKDRFVVVKEIRDPERFFKKVKEETGVDFMANKSGPQSLLSLNISANFGSGGGGGPIYETYGLSPTFLKQLGIEGPLCNRVFVANLPYNVTSAKVKELFILAGQVTDVELQVDKDGKNKGLAVVEYFHPIEAVQAISMLHGQRYMDRSMTVKMDRFEKPMENRRPGELPKGLQSVGMGLGANGAPLTNIAQLVASGSFGPSVPNQYSGGTTKIGSAFGAMGGGFGPSDMMGGGGGPSAMGLGGGDIGRLFSNPAAGSLNPLGSLSNSSVLNSVASAAAAAGLAGGSYRDRDLGDRGSAGGLGASGSGGYYGPTGGRENMPSSPYNSGGYGGGGSEMYSHRGGGGSAMGGGGDYERYGRSNSPIGRTGARMSRAIIIRNLPLDYSWQTLRDRLRGFGDVEFADIIQPGVGKIRFKTAADAEKAAVSLHGITVEGRPIAVDLAMPD